MHVEYACLDGSPFPVWFERGDDHELRWLLDREHAPKAMTPLAAAVRPLGLAGAERAYAESGLTMPSTLRRQPPTANGYDYHLEFHLPPDETEVFDAGLTRLTEQQGGTIEVWLNHCFPRVQQACSSIQLSSPDTPFAALAEQRDYAWGLTSVAGVVARRDLRAVAASCEPLFAERSTLVAYMLAQGFENETISSDKALWLIAQMRPDSREAKAARDEYLTTYGLQAVSWSIDHPTTAEQPELLDAQLRMLRKHRVGGVDHVEAKAGQRRRKLAADVAGALPSDEQRAQFARRVERLASFVPVREARARWQLVASGALRRAVLQRGRHLVERGVLDMIDDVFFLTAEEYDDPNEELCRAIAARRAEHQRWLAVTPPTVIGATRRDPVAAPRESVKTSVRGEPGAPGTAKGPARVILELNDVDRLEPGDVLVTIMTSPPWTPLFGVAAAVVTDAGDALSHVAIAAREYGIPCVVGTNHATALITDGTTVTVDGNTGTVWMDGGR